MIENSKQDVQSPTKQIPLASYISKRS